MNTHSIEEIDYELKINIFVDEICSMRPDIIAMQEVNQSCNAAEIQTDCIKCGDYAIKSDNHAYRTVSMLSERGLDYDWCYIPVKRGYGKYDEGLAVLSLYPISRCREILISPTDDYNNWRTRKALLVKLDKNRGYVCNVHFGWWDDIDDPFINQWYKLNKNLPDEKIWLMGDFNCPDTKKNEGYDAVKADGWTDLYREVSQVNGCTVPGSIDGWKGCAPKRIDYIWHNMPVKVKNAKVVFSQKPVSDHYGVFAEVADSESAARSCGILLPVFSLPSSYGIGCFDKCAYEFVDFLSQSGQKYWQILPLGTTGYGDSPYQSFSSFAGNPYYINLNELIELGLLDKQICDKTDFGSDTQQIDYEKLYHNRYTVLNYAYKKWNADSEFYDFCSNNRYWLDDYCLFMALKEHFGGKPWNMWDKDIRTREDYAVERYKERLKDRINFHKFMQYVFFAQWHKLKKYANGKGIKIIGDIPIYASYDSADCWVNPELFMLDENQKPVYVAGCPPDGFSPKGQLWGNPVYNWQKHHETNYVWWASRVAFSQKLYDVVRIDHFRGFDEYYSIPADAPDASFGSWKKGPGYSLFHSLEKMGIRNNFIAEDLGFVTDTVKELIARCGFPGMKVLQFAFDSRDDSSNEHKPYNYTKNSVVYTGTHDNHTISGWFSSISDKEKKNVSDYLGTTDVNDGLIRQALASVSDMCIIPLADYMGLGDEARINTPSTSSGNWCWRLNNMSFTDSLSKKLKTYAALYGRV